MELSKTANWQGATLWQLFSHHKPMDTRIKTENSDALEPLYRSS